MRKKWRFTPELIAYAPDGAGVYALWKDDEIIYFGRAEGSAETLRSCLLGHAQRGFHEATHYSWELARKPAVRESELLTEFWLARGCFPRCNEAETVERVVRKLRA